MEELHDGFTPFRKTRLSRTQIFGEEKEAEAATTDQTRPDHKRGRKRGRQTSPREKRMNLIKKFVDFIIRGRMVFC